MSNPLDVIAESLGLALRADRLVEAGTILDALDAAGYVVKPKPKPRTAPAALEPFVPSGEASVDAFMLAHHRPGWRAHLAAALKNRVGLSRMPAAPKGWAGGGTMTESERARLYEDHKVVQHSL